ncbi:putative Kef-type K+ transport protein [Halomonas stenophila]|uniref:Putative Kef-type K+ transport protein n=1 Tax=Halomonas stenophila TaxID=795312 RepID=A0A7W5ETX2_9GAMM|nr:cation:proton antiporter [Halomonas stenophila]MBB3231394.1 putative Kef-type K+ transport protein [Halomonas stenophila]
MPHDTTLITTLAAGLGLALVLGILADKLKLPALLGYLLAGIAIGPATPGYVADMATASQLAELGIMLLMFGVGLRFSLDNLLSVKHVALPGAIAQMTVATLLGMALAGAWGWGSVVAWCSASRCRWPARWYCSRRWKPAGSSRR